MRKWLGAVALMILAWTWPPESCLVDSIAVEVRCLNNEHSVCTEIHSVFPPDASFYWSPFGGPEPNEGDGWWWMMRSYSGETQVNGPECQAQETTMDGWLVP